MHNVFQLFKLYASVPVLTKHSQQVDVATLNETQLVFKRLTWCILVLAKEEGKAAEASSGHLVPWPLTAHHDSELLLSLEHALYLSWVHSFLFFKGFSGIPTTNLKSCFITYLPQSRLLIFHVYGPANKTGPQRICYNLG